MGDGGELERARAGLRIKRYDHVAKSELRQNFAKVAKILLLLPMYSRTNPAKLSKKPFDLILCSFGFVKAMKFRDWSEYSQVMS